MRTIDKLTHTHTHTHCTWGARCEPRGRDETLGGPDSAKNPDGHRLNLARLVVME